MSMFSKTNPFPYKRGVWLDFQTSESTIQLSSALESEKDISTFKFQLYDYGPDLMNFSVLIRKNLLNLILDQIGINKFLLMIRKAKRTYFHLMFLQIGGFNLYDMETPAFSLYTTESIGKNLRNAFIYQQKLIQARLPKPQPLRTKSVSSVEMLKLLLHSFSFDLAVELWSCFKSIRWTVPNSQLQKFSLSKDFPKFEIEQRRGGKASFQSNQIYLLFLLVNR